MLPARALRGFRIPGRWSQWWPIALFAAAFALIAVQHAPAVRPPQHRRQLLIRGEVLYLQRCAVCHGRDMRGHAESRPGTPSALVKPGFQAWFLVLPGAMEGFVRDPIAQGDEGMPAFGDQLASEDLVALAYLIHARNR